MLDDAAARNLVRDARVARMATVGPSGPHLVPVVFALDGDRIVTAVDHKPKRTRALRRLANLATDPRIALLVDHYEDDWSRLWWVRADGIATVKSDAEAVSAAVDLLVAKYDQYRTRPPAGPVIEIEVTRWRAWSALPPRRQ